MIIDLYRGLMDILVTENLNLENKLIEHIRPFHESRPLRPGESGFFNGYWNFMLEIAMVLFAKFIFVIGIVMITALAILFFPLDFIARLSTFAAKESEYQLKQTELGLQTELESEPKIEPKLEVEKK